jgi:hypothetical protein
MTYKELRTKLRAQGFINHEIDMIHYQYLATKAMGVDDADMLFDRDHGLLIHQRAKPKLDQWLGRQVAVDCQNDTAFEVRDGRRVH